MCTAIGSRSRSSLAMVDVSPLPPPPDHTFARRVRKNGASGGGSGGTQSAAGLTEDLGFGLEGLSTVSGLGSSVA